MPTFKQIFLLKTYRFLLLSLLALMGCNATENQTNTAEKLDKAAQSFVKLGLALGEYDKDYVDAYLGPKEWRVEAKQNLKSKSELAADINHLFKEIETLQPDNDQQKLRHKALLLNARAMDTRARMLMGETFSFAEEAALIYDAQIPDYDFAVFDQALEEIDKLIPGEGDLAKRVDAFRNQFNIEESKISKIVDLAIAECRRRSSQYITLPSNENFELEYVTNKSWSGYNWYQGGNKSLMQINLDFPMAITRAVDLGCHEGYPGHHVWNVLIENNLLKGKGWIEFSLFPLFSPYALIAEGSANFGIELAFPEQQKLLFEKDSLYAEAGLDPKTAQTLSELNKLSARLSHAQTAIAELYLNGEISREQAIEQRIKYSLISRARAEQTIRFTEQYRAYVLNYNLGKDLVSDYINSQAQDQKGKWQAFENMLTELSTASDMTQ